MIELKQADQDYIEQRPYESVMINEIFKSIQGEGKYLGVPSLFIRLAFCNLRCSWCDTKYAWKKPNIEMTVDDLIKMIRESGFKHIVFTGGEPMVQDYNLSFIILSSSYLDNLYTQYMFKSLME